MKHKFLSKLGLVLLIAGIFTSCNWVDPEINIDPNQPDDVPMDLLLPSVQARMGYNVVGGNDMTRVTSQWMQQLSGVARQSLSETNYIYRASDVNNLWGDVYSDALMDAKQIIIKATAEGAESPNFEGVAKICQAIVLGYATDVWGDLPWSEALLGQENFTPVFDSQESLYVVIQQLLDEGIAKCSVPADQNTIPVNGDVIFEGDMDKWIAAAYALKARYALHLAKRDGDAYNKALNHLNNAFTTNAGNMKYYYASGNNLNANPLYLFNENRTDVRMCATLVDSLKNHQDPRLPVFVEPITVAFEFEGVSYVPGDFVGAPPGSDIETFSMPGPGIASSGTPTPIITATEVHFMRAECLAMTGNPGGARDAYKVALQTSLEEYGVFNQTWFDAYSSAIDVIPDNLLMRAIMTEKWISLTYNTETFNDWRRTGFPVLTPNPNGEIEEVPRRFPYAVAPITYNAANVPDLGNRPLTVRVWWDEPAP